MSNTFERPDEKCLGRDQVFRFRERMVWGNYARESSQESGKIRSQIIMMEGNMGMGKLC